MLYQDVCVEFTLAILTGYPLVDWVLELVLVLCLSCD